MVRCSRSTPKRGGWTLIELMVVIAIIAVVVGLGIGGLFSVVDAQRNSNTENAMRTINKTLIDHWKKVVEDAKTEDPSPAIKNLASGDDARANLANGDDARARVLWIKFRLVEAFPQSFAEIARAAAGQGIYGNDASGRPWIPLNRRYMANYFVGIQGALTSSKHDPLTESAACLYLALTVNRGGRKLDEANLVGFVVDTDGDGAKELVDNWGTALFFQRFMLGCDNGTVAASLGNLYPGVPTNAAVYPTITTTLTNALVAFNLELDKLNPNSRKPNFSDPVDPDGLLQQAASPAVSTPWYATPPNGPLFTQLCNNPFWPPQGRTPQPYSVPYTISFGRLGRPDYNGGLNLDFNNYICSFRLSVGSQ